MSGYVLKKVLLSKKKGLTRQERTLSARIGLPFSHCLGLTYPSKYRFVDLHSLLVPLTAA